MKKTDHLITADSYVNQGFGLKHNSPMIGIRLPEEKKAELDKVLDSLVAKKKADSRIHYIRNLLYQVIEDHRDLLEEQTADDAIATPETPIEPPAKKTTRARKKSVS